MPSKIKVAVLIGARGRAALLNRTLWTLTRQTHPCTVYVADDGTEGDSVASVSAKYGKFKGVIYNRLRGPVSPLRGQNMAWWWGYEQAKEDEIDYVICSHPEIMVPLNAVEQMLDEHIKNRRSVPLIYCLSPKHQEIIDDVDWKSDIHNLKELEDFWNYMSHWAVRNRDTAQWYHHFGFTGMYIDEWDFYNKPDGFLPKRDEIYFDDAWMIHEELKVDRPPQLLTDMEVYHQYHEWERELGKPPEAWTKQFTEPHLPSAGRTPAPELSRKMAEIADTLMPDGTLKEKKR